MEVGSTGKSILLVVEQGGTHEKQLRKIHETNKTVVLTQGVLIQDLGIKRRVAVVSTLVTQEDIE